jgi:AAA15 family ATPase/GTPase
MRAAAIEIENFRSFVKTSLRDMGPVNVLIGPNNAGKSSVLKALYLIQNEAVDADVRVGSRP